MAELGLSAYDSEGKFKGLNTVFSELSESLKGYTDEERDTYLAMIGGKQQIKTLNALLNATNEEYTSLKASVTDADGALNDMATTMQDNAKGNITRFKSQVEGLGIQLAENLLPHVNNIIEKLSEFVDWFSNLDEGTQGAIMKFTVMTATSGIFFKVLGGGLNILGGFTNGLGSLLKVFGKSTRSVSAMTNSVDDALDIMRGASSTSVTTSRNVGLLGRAFGGVTKYVNPLGIAVMALSGTMYTLKKANDFSNKSILDTKDSMSLMELGFAKLSGTSVYTKEELEKLGYTYRDFSGINEDTAKSLEKSSEKFRDLRFEIDKVGLDGVITPEESEGVIKRTGELCNGIIAEIRAREQESNDAWKSIFDADQLIDEQEQRILDKIKGQADSEAEAVQNKNNRINELMRISAEEQRELSVVEQGELDRLVDELNQTALENFKLTEEEKLKIKQSYINRSHDLDLESMSKLLGEESTKRDEAINTIREDYDGRLQALKQGLSSLEGEDRLFAERKIADLERDKNLAIQKERDKYDEFIQVAQENSPKLLAELDKHNGKILNNSEKNLKKQISDMSGRYNEMSNVTETGMYRLYDTQDKVWKDVYVNMDSTTGEIIGLWDTTVNTIAGKPGIAKVEEAEGNQRTWDNTKKKWMDVVNHTKNNPAKGHIIEDDRNPKNLSELNRKFFEAKGKIDKSPAKAKIEEDSGNDNKLSVLQSKWANLKTDIEKNPITMSINWNQQELANVPHVTGSYRPQAQSVSAFSVDNLVDSMRNTYSDYSDQRLYAMANRMVQTNDTEGISQFTEPPTYGMSRKSISITMPKINTSNIGMNKVNSSYTNAKDMSDVTDLLKDISNKLDDARNINFNIDKIDAIDQGSKEATVHSMSYMAKSFIKK